MQVFKTRWFSRWARNEGLGDDAIARAADEMNQGLIDAQLGGQLVKKRLALPGRGKRGSTRTLVALRPGSRACFLYGFSKNERANIRGRELQALKVLADELLSYSAQELTRAIRAGELIEVESDG